MTHQVPWVKCMIKLMRAGHMLLVGGKKPKIFLTEKVKKKKTLRPVYGILENYNHYELLFKCQVG